jgi:PIN domain nuclease of toxin-antitoxin system
MRMLLDTHLLLWAAEDSPRLSVKARALISDAANEKVFSVASLWEIAVKSTLRRADFAIDGARLRAEMRSNSFTELTIRAEHALFTARLQAIHKDPFDRLLVAQALVEDLTLLTSDPVVASYSTAIMLV